MGGRLAACVGTSHSYLTALSTGNTVSPAVSQRAGPLPISLPRSRALPWRRRRHPLESARATSCLPWGRAGWEGRDTVLGVNIPWSFPRFLGSGGARRSAGRPAPPAPSGGAARRARALAPGSAPCEAAWSRVADESAAGGAEPTRGFAASGELRGVPSMWFLRPNCLLPASPRSSGSEGPREASGLKDNEDPSAKTTRAPLRTPDPHQGRVGSRPGLRGPASGHCAEAPGAAKGLGRRGTRAGAPAPVN